ncbi:MAG: ABC transporter substrate-binding protein [Bdellovibrionota bacterium]
MRSTIIIFVLASVLSSITTLAEDLPKLKLGVIASFSGPLAEFGTAIQNGMKIAQLENNGENKILEIIYEDSKYDTKTAISNFKKLTAVDNVDLLYVFGGPMSESLSPLAESAKVPLFSTEYDTSHTIGRKYVMRFANNAEDYASALLSELRKKSIKKLGVFKCENQYHNTLVTALNNSLRGGESIELLGNFQPNETDFRSAISKMRGKDFDALGLYLLPGMQHAFLKQYAQQGFQHQLFGTDSFDSESEVLGVEKNVEGLLYANNYASDKFKKRYVEKYGNDRQLIHGVLGYEFVLLVLDLMQGAETLTSDKIISKFQTIKDRNSDAGVYSYKNSAETGQYFNLPIAIRTINKGKSSLLRLKEMP